MGESQGSGGANPLPPAQRKPHPDNFDPRHPLYEKVMARHDAAMAAGQSRYRDPISGAMVETAEAIWNGRGCCNLGCRHCPFGPR
ncbi:MAG: DUF5522 domain-containing protein [Planctomycetota bacterium]|nr:DUF5522 domain-containing protein [Planctomycetota bacterium]